MILFLTISIWLTGFLTLIFILLSVLVKLDLVSSIDTFIYHLCTFKMNDILTSIFKVFTFFGSTAFIVALSVLLFVVFLILKKKTHAYLTASVIIISTILNNVIKVIIMRSRPEALEVLKLVIETSYSFPSGHTMASVTIYGILLYLVNKTDLKKGLKNTLKVILFTLPIFIGISRIYLGAHFATDVIGAYLVSSILLLVTTYLVDKKNLI